MSIKSLNIYFSYCGATFEKNQIMQTIQLPPNYAGPSPGFVRATIKIANPTWTPEQIDAELQKKMLELLQPNNDGSCEFCSS